MQKVLICEVQRDTVRMNEHLEVYFSIVLEERGGTPLVVEDLLIIYEITQQAQFTVKHLEWKEQYGSGKKKVVILSRNNMLWFFYV